MKTQYSTCSGSGNHDRLGQDLEQAITKCLLECELLQSLCHQEWTVAVAQAGHEESQLNRLTLFLLGFLIIRKGTCNLKELFDFIPSFGG